MQQKPARASSRPNRVKSNPNCLTCPETGQEVWITTATLPDIKLAQKTKKCPLLAYKKRLYFVTVASPAVRQSLYDQMATALQTLEERMLPEYGGRPWTVSVRVTDATNTTSKTQSPFFIWNGGQLELAAWPNLVEKIPAPPRFPGYAQGGGSSGSSRQKLEGKRGNTSRKLDDEMVDEDQEEEEEEEEEEQPLSAQDVWINDLLDRPCTLLSNLAYNQRSRAPLPQISVKWMSPLHEPYYTRKSAYARAVELCQQEVVVDRVLHGYNANGLPVKIQPMPPVQPVTSKRMTLKAGKIRFERDGLWVVGQELNWQIDRIQQYEQKYSLKPEENDDDDANDPSGAMSGPYSAGKRVTESFPKDSNGRRLSALGYYLQCNRVEHRMKRLQELNDTENDVHRRTQALSPHSSEPSSLVEYLDMMVVPEAANLTHPVGSEVLATASAADHAISQEAPYTALADFSGTAVDTASTFATPAIEMAHNDNTTPGQPVNAVSAGTCSASLQTLTSGDTTAHPTSLTGPNLATAMPPISVAANIKSENKKKKANAVCFTLRDADRELRIIWKSLNVAERDKWTRQYNEYMTNWARTHTSCAVEEVWTPSQEAMGDAKQQAVYAVQTFKPEVSSDAKSGAKNEVCTPGTDGYADAKPQQVTTMSEGTNQPSFSEQPSPLTPSTVFSLNTHKTVTGIITPTSESEEKHLTESSRCTTTMASLTGIACAQTESTGPVDSNDVIIRASKTSTSSPIEAPSSSPVNLEKRFLESQMYATETASGSITQTETEMKPRAVPRKKPVSVAVERLQSSIPWRLNDDQIQLCFNAGMEHFDQIMRTVKARDLHRELQDGFDLLRERGRGRYDMEIPAFDDSLFSFLTDIKKAPWMPLVREILGKDVVLIHKGMFLSLPGAERQVYHQDGLHLTTQYQKPCHAINVFIPLLDMTMEHGPTEFCLGSHILGNDELKSEFLETPLVSAGTPIIFDYRLGHRGNGNSSSSCRPIVYCTYAKSADGKEFRDSVNFSRKRYHKIGELVSKAPSREERAQKRGRLLGEYWAEPDDDEQLG